MVAFTHAAVAVDGADVGIRAVSISPGPIRTPRKPKRDYNSEGSER